MTATIHVGDCRDVLATLPDQSVQTCVTSPPYFGLRDYGVDGQIGLESTVEAFVENLVDVFREVRRVLKDDGTLWLNLGDSYAGGGGYYPDAPSNQPDAARGRNAPGAQINGSRIKGQRNLHGLKPKDLIGIPWRVAFALQQDGWYLRQDIVWAKPNPMPESVRDRCTKSHEYIFLLTKAPRYYYDAAAIAEQSDPAQHEHNQKYARPYDNEARIAGGQPGNVNNVGIHSRPGNGTRNKRSVWTVSTQPFSEAHFATFPPKLIEPCILAGTLPRGAYEPDDMILTPTGEGERDDDPSLVTGRAGMNRPRRPLEAVRPISRAEQAAYAEQLRLSPHRAAMEAEAGATTFAHYIRTDASGARPVPPALLDAWIDRGWLGRISIPPRLADPSRSTVLDPFAGAGTTGLVADRLNRDFIGIELNPEYAEIAKRRIYNDAPMFATVEVLA